MLRAAADDGHDKPLLREQVVKAAKKNITPGAFTHAII